MQSDESYVKQTIDDRLHIGSRDLDGPKKAELEERLSADIAKYKTPPFEAFLNSTSYIFPELYEKVLLIASDIAKHADIPPNQRPSIIVVSNYSLRMNALALPEGDIVLDESLFMSGLTEAGLAGIIAHEFGHIALRHSQRRDSFRKNLIPPFYIFAGVYYFGMQDEFGQIIAGRFSVRSQSEADRLGVQYMYLAGYDPSEFSKFIISELGSGMRLVIIRDEIKAMEKAYPQQKISKFRYMTKKELESAIHRTIPIEPKKSILDQCIDFYKFSIKNRQ